jgi:hypothetical protein
MRPAIAPDNPDMQVLASRTQKQRLIFRLHDQPLRVDFFHKPQAELGSDGREQVTLRHQAGRHQFGLEIRAVDGGLSGQLEHPARLYPQPLQDRAPNRELREQETEKFVARLEF